MEYHVIAYRRQEGRTLWPEFVENKPDLEPDVPNTLHPVDDDLTVVIWWMDDELPATLEGLDMAGADYAWAMQIVEEVKSKVRGQ